MSVKITSKDGEIVISKEVFKAICSKIVFDSYGVVGMTAKTLAQDFANLLKRDNSAKGVEVEIKDTKISLTMHVMVELGVNIKAVSQNVIDNVKFKVKDLTGFDVEKVVICVTSIRS